MESVDGISITVTLIVVSVAAAIDFWTFRLPNTLTMTFFMAGVLYHSATGGTEGLVASLLGALVGAMPLIPLYARGGMGAGDVKLTAGIGAWLGAWHVLHVAIIAGLATGIYAAGIAVRKRTRSMRNRIPKQCLDKNCLSQVHLKPVTEITAAVRSADARDCVVPFGSMLALGVMGTIVWLCS